MRGACRPPLRPQTEGIVHPIGEPRLCGGLVQILQRALHQIGILDTRQLRALLRGEQVGAPRLVEVERRLHGAVARNRLFLEWGLALGVQAVAEHFGRGPGVLPIRSTQQHHDLARELVGQLLRGLRDVGCLLVQWEQRQHIGINTVLMPETPLVRAHAQHHQQPDDGGGAPQPASGLVVEGSGMVGG